MGDNAAAGEIVEPEVEDVKSAAWRRLDPKPYFSGHVKMYPEEVKWLATRSKSLHEKPLALYN